MIAAASGLLVRYAFSSGSCSRWSPSHCEHHQAVCLILFATPAEAGPPLSRYWLAHHTSMHTLRTWLLQVWSSEALREQFLALPLPAVRCLLASELTAVAAENTALVALAGWVEEGPAGRAATPAQRKELLSLVSQGAKGWFAVCVRVRLCAACQQQQEHVVLAPLAWLCIGFLMHSPVNSLMTAVSAIKW